MNNIPTITKNLLIVNVVVFLATYLFRNMGVDLNNVLGLHFFLAPDFHIYQLFTYMFAHGGFSHIFFNMFALWMFGCIVERTWGPKKFLTYYIVCGVGAGLFQELAQFAQFYLIASEQLPHFTLAQTMKVANANAAFLNLWTTVGASGAVYGILLAFGMLYPEERIFIFPLPVPIKAKWFVMGYAAIELFMAYSSTGDGVAHLAHLGGMVFGFFLIRYWRHHPDIRYSRRSRQQFFDSMRASWERRTGRKDRGGVFTNSANTRHESDWDYNARRKAEQERMDEILDKIRRNGYESLTREEKQQLFDASNRK
ncbi:rhomboid family intramembrane serine protease [Leyella stercorea]|uniref:rhomboid family intramembrane serine protease n=1 Tax=Leyella stercorea TaxID=363265 RepID=UPI00242EBF79|nr:rhomboid family intramembrane serine protease [Leyella stercorea]